MKKLLSTSILSLVLSSQTVFAYTSGGSSGTAFILSLLPGILIIAIIGGVIYKRLLRKNK